MLRIQQIYFLKYIVRDITKRYKRHGELELVENGKLTEKRKKDAKMGI